MISPPRQGSTLKLGLLAGCLVLPLAGAALADGDGVGVFSRQRALERLGERASDSLPDQRLEGGAARPAPSALDHQIERLARSLKDIQADPVSPAEVEGALDAAYAPLTPVLDLPAGTVLAPSALEGPTPGGCAAIKAAPQTSWGLLGALDRATFTWVDGVGKVRTLRYRLSPDGQTMTLHISVAGRLAAIETYHRQNDQTAGVELRDGSRPGTLTLEADRFSYEAEHELGSFRLDGDCNLILEGRLRNNPRQIRDIYYNTTGANDPRLDPTIMERSARRIARLRKAAGIGLARHS